MCSDVSEAGLSIAVHCCRYQISNTDTNAQDLSQLCLLSQLLVVSAMGDNQGQQY